MPSLIDECTRILGCSPQSLWAELNDVLKRDRVVRNLQGSIVKTLYHDRLGLKKSFTFDGLTWRGANKTLAYGRLNPIFNCTIVQFFYTRHGIRLQYPYLPCVVEKVANGEDRFYPLELLELLWTSPSEDELSLYLGDMFKEVEIERKKCEDCGQLRGPTPTFDDDDDDDESSAEECSTCGFSHADGQDAPAEPIPSPPASDFMTPCSNCGEFHEENELTFGNGTLFFENCWEHSIMEASMDMD